MNGIMMNTESGLPTGTWTNPQTGDTITIRDCYFENNDMILHLTDGRQVNANILERYVQGGTPGMKLPATPPPSQPSNNTKLLEGLSENFMDVDWRKENVTEIQFAHNAKTEVVDEDKTIILKTLSKAKNPTFNVDITWKKFPLESVKFILNTLDIKKDKVIDCIIEKYVNLDDIKESLIKQMNTFVENKLSEK